MAKAMVSCVVDCGDTMIEKCDDLTPYSKLSIASTVVQSLLTDIIMNYKTAEFSLVSSGGVSSHGHVGGHKKAGSKSVEEVVPMSRVNTTVLSTVQDMFKLQQHSTNDNTTVSRSPCCYTDGLETALEILKSVNVGKKFHRILLFITDGESPIEKYERLEAYILPELIKQDCSFYIAFIGNQNNSNSIISSDIAEIKWENASLFHSIVSNINTNKNNSGSSAAGDGKIIQSTQPGELVSLFTNIPGLSTTPRATKINFTMGSNSHNNDDGITIPCQYYASVSKQALPSLKKVTKATLRNILVGDTDSNSGSSTVKRDTSYRNPDAPDEEIFNENKVKGYKYGSQYVPFNSTEENLFKVQGPAGIELIGFLPRDKVPHYHYLGATNILQGDNRLISAQLAMIHLSKAMRKKGQVALVRFVKKDDADPFLAALMPRSSYNKNTNNMNNNNTNEVEEEEEDGTLLVQQLPCIEDVREYDFPPLPTPSPISSLSSSSSSSSSTTNHNKSSSTQQQQQSILLQQVVDAMTVQKLPSLFLPPYNYAQQCVRAAIRTKLSKLQLQQQSSASSSHNNNNNTSTTFSNLSFLPTMEAPFQDSFDPSYVFSYIIAPHLLQQRQSSSSSSALITQDSMNTNAADTTRDGVHTVTELQQKINQFSTVFNLKYLDPSQTKKRTFWSDVQLTGTESGTGGEEKETAAAKKSRGQVKITIKDDTGAFSTKPSGCSYTGPVLSSGSVNPSDDFAAVVEHLNNMLLLDNNNEELLKFIKEIFRQNAATLQDIIVRLVTTGGTAAYHRKAVQCIKTYRMGAVKFGESDTYNAFLSTVIKPSFSPFNGNTSKHSAFWELLKAESNQTTLINQEEDSNSSYIELNDTASSQFFESEILSASSAPAIASMSSEINEEDDIFADLA